MAELAPKPDVPARLRKLPSSAGADRSCFLLRVASCSRSTLTAAALNELSASQPQLAVPRSCAPHLQLQRASTAPRSSRRSRRKLRLRSAAAASATFALQSPRARASTTALSPGRFKLELTLGQDAHDKLEQLRELLRHQNPSGDLTSIVERALSELLEREMKRRFAQTSTPKQRVAREQVRSKPRRSRRKRAALVPGYIPAQALGSRPDAGGKSKRQGMARASRATSLGRCLREVHARDAGQCTFVSPDGRRCTARGFLEVHHHDTTFARGGAATADNLRLTCRAHNLFFAEQDYGRELYAAQGARSSRSADSAPARRTGAGLVSWLVPERRVCRAAGSFRSSPALRVGCRFGGRQQDEPRSRALACYVLSELARSRTTPGIARDPCEPFSWAHFAGDRAAARR